MPFRQQTGKIGEDQARAFLEERGFAVVAQNFSVHQRGEIDLIVRRDNEVIFVEVKNHRANRYGGPLYAISNAKKKTLRKMAEYFLAENPDLNQPDIVFRFDLIALSEDSIEWVQDIIR